MFAACAGKTSLLRVLLGFAGSNLRHHLLTQFTGEYVFAMSKSIQHATVGMDDTRTNMDSDKAANMIHIIYDGTAHATVSKGQRVPVAAMVIHLASKHTTCTCP
jgi:nucleoside-diphosphate-sugar epimerase